MSFRANLTGACDKWCKSSVERDPSIRATLKNPSPLLAAGEDTEAALPGDSLEDRATNDGNLENFHTLKSCRLGSTEILRFYRSS